MRALPLRTSVTLWFVGLATTVLVLASAALFLGVRAALLAGLDAELRARAEGIASLCEWEEDHIELEGELEVSLDTPVLRGASAIELREWPSMALVRAFGAALPAVAVSDSMRPRTLEREEPLRVVAVRVRLQDPDATERGEAPRAGEVLVRVGGSLVSVRRSLVWLAGFAFVTCVLAVVAVAGFGAFLGRRVAQPLQELGAAAAAVRPGAAADLPKRGTNDEVDQLAAILSTTFSSLHLALERQRRFTADASHELRTPIAILRTEAEVALRRERTDAEHRALTARFLETALRMGRMVESLLTLTRLDVPATRAAEPVDLGAIVDEALMERPAGERLRFAARHAPGASAGLRGDADLLRMLVDNLLANAERYAESSVEIDVTRSGSVVALCVRDDGPGVPDEERPLLFERFYRGSDMRGHSGAGLGLALVDAIARAHGGRCTAEPAYRCTAEPSRPGLHVHISIPC
ncbi:MAG: ATP-binding protein [Planctomycetota bacterium]